MITQTSQTRQSQIIITRNIWKMLGPFATASRFTLPFTRCHYCRTPPLSHAACASMSTTTTTTTTTTRDRWDRYGPMEWAQLETDLHSAAHKVVTWEALGPGMCTSETIKKDESLGEEHSRFRPAEKPTTGKLNRVPSEVGNVTSAWSWRVTLCDAICHNGL